MHVDFITGINIPQSVPPVRAYVHKTGFERVYHGSRDGAKACLLKNLGNSQMDLSEFDYVLAAIWGEEYDEVIDFIGFNDIEDTSGERWKNSNPGVSAWNVRNGIYVPSSLSDGEVVFNRINQVTCGDTMIVLGEEEKYRRGTESLEEYARNPPLSLRRFFKD